MDKSVVIIVIAVWLFCAIYLTLGWKYNLPYLNAVMVASWIASVALLVFIIIFIRKHKSK